MCVRDRAPAGGEQARRFGRAPCAWQLGGTLLQWTAGPGRQSLACPRAGIVHRLDKDTSGLMVVARDRACMDALVALIAERKVKRQYVAHGTWSLDRCPNPLGRRTHRARPSYRLRMAVVDLAVHLAKPLGRISCALKAVNEGAGCNAPCTPGARTRSVCMASLRHPARWAMPYGGAPVGDLATPGLARLPFGFLASCDGGASGFRAPYPTICARRCQNGASATMRPEWP